MLRVRFDRKADALLLIVSEVMPDCEVRIDPHVVCGKKGRELVYVLLTGLNMAEKLRLLETAPTERFTHFELVELPTDHSTGDPNRGNSSIIDGIVNRVLRIFGRT